MWAYCHWFPSSLSLALPPYFLIWCRGDPWGWCFHVTTPTSAEQEAQSLKCPAKLLVPSWLCFSSLATFLCRSHYLCFTQEALSAAHTLSLSKLFVFLRRVPLCMGENSSPLNIFFGGFKIQIVIKLCWCCSHNWQLYFTVFYSRLIV